MCKITLSDEDGTYKTCLASETETPIGILQHFHVNPDTKIVYLNGKILSREKMAKPIPNTGLVHLAIRNKTVMRT